MERTEFYSKWALRITLAAAFVYDVIFIQYWIGAIGGAAIFALTYAIDKLNVKKRVFGSTLLSIFYIFCILAEGLGVMFRFYSLITWWDTFVHLLSGMVLAYAGVRLLKVLPGGSALKGVTRFLFVAGIACMGGAVWEICEFAADSWFGLDTQCAIATGVGDTMIDLIADMAGGVIFGAFNEVWDRMRHKAW